MSVRMVYDYDLISMRVKETLEFRYAYQIQRAGQRANFPRAGTIPSQIYPAPLYRWFRRCEKVDCMGDWTEVWGQIRATGVH